MLTEEEGIKLAAAQTTFCRRLAALAADIVLEFSPEIAETVVESLQDSTSLYSPFVSDIMQKSVNARRTWRRSVHQQNGRGR